MNSATVEHTSETAARLTADPSLTSVRVAFYLSDGSSARSAFPWDGRGDPVEDVQNLIREKKRSGSLLAVDSIDSDPTRNAERLIVPSQIVAVVVSAGE